MKKPITVKGMSLNGKVSVVTGGGSGIGLATANKLAGLGSHVVVMDYKYPETKAHLFDKKHKSKITRLKVDVRNYSEVEKAINSIISQFKRIDILVNSAGVVGAKPFIESTPSEWTNLIQTNVIGVLNTTICVGKYMIPKKYGKIVNLASVHGIGSKYAYKTELSANGAVVYAMTKGGVVAFTKALAVEWAKYQININAVAPTITNTPMNADLFSSSKKLALYKKLIPIGKWAEPQDIADAIAFLSSEEARMITGQILAVDGGYLSV